MWVVRRGSFAMRFVASLAADRRKSRVGGGRLLNSANETISRVTADALRTGRSTGNTRGVGVAGNASGAFDVMCQGIMAKLQSPELTVTDSLSQLKRCCCPERQHVRCRGRSSFALDVGQVLQFGIHCVPLPFVKRRESQLTGLPYRKASIDSIGGRVIPNRMAREAGLTVVT